MLPINMKHVAEIAGGLFIGSLASDAVNGAVKLSKKGFVKFKEKKQSKKNEAQ